MYHCCTVELSHYTAASHHPGSKPKLSRGVARSWSDLHIAVHYKRKAGSSQHPAARKYLHRATRAGSITLLTRFHLRTTHVPATAYNDGYTVANSHLHSTWRKTAADSLRRVAVPFLLTKLAPSRSICPQHEKPNR